MEPKMYIVSVIWDSSKPDAPNSHILIEADQVVCETADEIAGIEFLLQGKAVLSVPEANYRGHRESGKR